MGKRGGTFHLREKALQNSSSIQATGWEKRWFTFGGN